VSATSFTTARLDSLAYRRPHDGKQLTSPILLHALEEGYGLSTPLAQVLVHGGIYLLGQAGAFCLKDLARHNRIEHDASLVHDDTKGRDEYAPISPDLSLVKKLLLQAKDGHVLTAEDIARARVERESICPVLNGLHSEIARGEMAIALGLFGQGNGDHQGVPLGHTTRMAHGRTPPRGLETDAHAGATADHPHCTRYSHPDGYDQGLPRSYNDLDDDAALLFPLRNDHALLDRKVIGNVQTRTKYYHLYPLRHLPLSISTLTLPIYMIMLI
jgi:hypothetical protein